MSQVLKIAISVGELSADEYASELVSSIQSYQPLTQFKGMGGSNLRKVGVETIIDSEALAGVMGIYEVFKNIRNVFHSFSSMKALLLSWKPDLLIIVDYPDFNLRLAKVAKSLGIPVFYYIPPQLWAWRSGRARLIGKIIDQAAVIFPFEEQFYRERSCHNITFIGHPFVDRWKNSQLREDQKIEFLKSVGLDPNRPILALFPGSRPTEVKRLLAIVQKTFQLLQQKHPELQGILAVAPSLDQTEIQGLLNRDLPITIIKGKATEIMQCSTAGVLKSGTSNLQAAVCGLPFTMIYLTSRTTELIVRLLVKIKQFSIVNVIKPETVTELVQAAVTPERICADLEPLLFDHKRHTTVRSALTEIARSLEYQGNSKIFEGCTTVSQRAAKLALNTLFLEK